MKFAIFLSFLFFIIVGAQALFSFSHAATTFEPDFSIFYTSAKDVLQKVSPYADKQTYTAFNYPLTTVAIVIPLIAFPYPTAQEIFTVINGICLFAIIFLSIRLSKQKITITNFLFLLSLALLFFPTKFTFGMGQINLLAYTFLLAGTSMFSKNKTKTAMVLFVLGIICKPILLFISVLFLLQKRYLFFILLLIFSGIVIFLLPILLQSSASITFIKQLTHMSFAGREVYYNQGLTGFISRFTPNILLREYLTYITSAVLFVVTILVVRKRTFLQQFSILLTLLVILDPLSWQHHFIFLIFPFIQLFFEFFKKKSLPNTLLLFLSYLLIAMNIKTPQSFILFPERIFLSHVFFGAVLLFILQLLYNRKT